MVDWKRAGDLKESLVGFGMSPRFESEFSDLVAQAFPDGTADEAAFDVLLDAFVLQHELRSGRTVVEEFVADHPDLPDDEKRTLLGWRDVVQSVFEVAGKRGDRVTLVDLADQRAYPTLSNMGRDGLKPFRKGKFAIGRIVPLGDAWMLSGPTELLPPSARALAFAMATMPPAFPEEALHAPERQAEAPHTPAEQHEAFVEEFGTDLIVVPGPQVDEVLRRLYDRIALRADPEAGPSDVPAPDLPDFLLDSEGVGIHSLQGAGVALYPDYHLAEAAFADPALVARRRPRETLTELLEDPEIPPDALRRLADRAPDAASKIFARLLKRKGFSWPDEGEELLREYKPDHFEDDAQTPGTVVLSPETGENLPDSGGAVPSPTVHRIKVSLAGARPPIWRRLEVPSAIRLRDLHLVFQTAFAWENYHMWLFETPAGDFGVPDRELGHRDAASVRLDKIAPHARDEFAYVYDFGDDWGHKVLVEAVSPAEPGVAYPRCLTGRRAAPPEDCGGIWGYADLLDVLADPEHENHQDMLEWLNLDSPDDFDPAAFDAAEINRELSEGTPTPRH